MIKTLCLFIFFAVTAYDTRQSLNPLSLEALAFIAALVLAVIYFLDLIGHPTPWTRTNA